MLQDPLCFYSFWILFQFRFIEKKFNWPGISMVLFRWRCLNSFYGEGLSLLSGYPVPGKRLFPLYWQHRQLPEVFLSSFEIVYHVLQLMELDIFRTVCHCFFLLFLIFPLYQKTGTFPSKTADLPRLESAEKYSKNASFMCIFSC